MHDVVSQLVPQRAKNQIYDVYVFLIPDSRPLFIIYIIFIWMMNDDGMSVFW
jgi:hypothetical protein